MESSRTLCHLIHGEQEESTEQDLAGEVETIYANFDYLCEMKSFVRYMPVTDGYDPSIHAKDENEKRLFGNWRKYLDAAESEFKQGDTSLN